MITIPLEDDKVLAVDFDWNSGTHKYIKISKISVNDWSYLISLDQLLTKDQIKGLEAIIAVTVKNYIEENEDE